MPLSEPLGLIRAMCRLWVRVSSPWLQPHGCFPAIRHTRVLVLVGPRNQGNLIYLDHRVPAPSVSAYPMFRDLLLT
jgi:hypothetical protein